MSTVTSVRPRVIGSSFRAPRLRSGPHRAAGIPDPARGQDVVHHTSPAIGTVQYVGYVISAVMKQMWTGLSTRKVARSSVSCDPMKNAQVFVGVSVW